MQITGVKRNVLFLQRVRMQKLIKGSIRNVSRSGEKGRTASLWLVGESRLLYVRTKGNIAEALNYNLLMYRGGHMGKKGILSNLYGVCEYIDLVVKNRLKKLQDS